MTPEQQADTYKSEADRIAARHREIDDELDKRIQREIEEQKKRRPLWLREQYADRAAQEATQIICARLQNRDTPANANEIKSVWDDIYTSILDTIVNSLMEENQS